MVTADVSTQLTFSVIVNTVDRAEQLRTLLRALEHQSYAQFEVIMVVGPTHDHTLDILRDYQGRVVVLRCPEANLSLSRNIGLLGAHGDIVAYIDDDAVPSVNWLASFARLFRNPRLDGTGGEVHLVHPDLTMTQHRLGIVSSLGETVNVRTSWTDELATLARASKGQQWFPRMMGANMAFRRKALLAIGGFDAFYIYIAEEPDVALRMAQHGRVSYSVLQAPVYHVPASSRNRVVSAGVGRYRWMNTRSFTYFSIRHGRANLEPTRAIAVRALQLAHGHVITYNRMRRKQQIGLGTFTKMSALEVRGLMEGVAGALIAAPQTIAHEDAQRAIAHDAPIRPFQTSQSALQPSVDPISGHQPSIRMTEPPLRVCLLSKAYPSQECDDVARLTHLMARGLFELGHSVHVITNGEREGVSFFDGAYVHTIRTITDRYTHLSGLPRLHRALNYSHAVHEKVNHLLRNDGVQLVDSALWQFEGLATAISGTLPVAVRLTTSGAQVAHDDDARLCNDMARELVKRADLVLSDTQTTVHTIEQSFTMKIPGDRCVVVPATRIAMSIAQAYRRAIATSTQTRHTDEGQTL